MFWYLKNTKKKGIHHRMSFFFGAGYGSRTRLFGLGSRRTTDVLTPQIDFAVLQKALLLQSSIIIALISLFDKRKFCQIWPD